MKEKIEKAAANAEDLYEDADAVIYHIDIEA